MSTFGKILFSGSRFIFWSLAPILALCAAVLPFLVTKWTAARFFFVALIEALLLTLILGLHNPQRFRWAIRCVTGIVFCVYLAYAIDEVFLSGRSLEAGSDSQAEASPRNAILGFIAIGLPCLWYALFGRFSLKRENNANGSEPELPEKVETIDLDI